MECQEVDVGTGSKAREIAVRPAVEEVTGSQESGCVSRETEKVSKYIEILGTRILTIREGIYKYEKGEGVKLDVVSLLWIDLHNSQIEINVCRYI